MMQINNKFEIGQEVYILEKRQCSICNGMGKFYYQGYEMECPRCKEYKAGRYKVMEGSYKITGIKINTRNGVDFSIRYNAEGNKRPENRVFATYEGAVAACEKLNKELEDQETNLFGKTGKFQQQY